MNQKEHAFGLSIKDIVISLIIQFLSFFLLTFLFSCLLLRFQKYENYVELSMWVITVLVSLICAWISKTKGVLSLLYAGTGSFLFSLICIGIGLLSTRDNLFSNTVILRFLMHIALSLVFAFLIKFFSKKKRKGHKFHFSK